MDFMFDKCMYFVFISVFSLCAEDASELAMPPFVICPF